MRHQAALGLFAISLSAAAPSLRAAGITFSQAPDPFVAQEGTSGNIGFITLKNTDPDQIAFITKILALHFNATGGESDDQATNLALVTPNPTVQNPVQIGPNGTGTIKFSWDAVDEIRDNDIDFGDWDAVFSVDYHYVRGTDLSVIPVAHVRVTDAPVPEPSTASLILIGIGLFVIGGYRFKSKKASTDSKVHQRPHATFRIRRGKCANAPLHIAQLTER